jgi:hypothetical protein
MFFVNERINHAISTRGEIIQIDISITREEVWFGNQTAGKRSYERLVAPRSSSLS